MFLFRSVCQVPVAEGKSVQQTVDLLHKKLEQLGAVKQGSFCVDCETYHATGNVSGKYLTNLLFVWVCTLSDIIDYFGQTSYRLTHADVATCSLVKIAFSLRLTPRSCDFILYSRHTVSVFSRVVIPIRLCNISDIQHKYEFCKIDWNERGAPKMKVRKPTDLSVAWSHTENLILLDPNAMLGFVS